MSILDEPDSIEGVDEVCETCAHCYGPVVLLCNNPKSEFFGEVCHPLGYCPAFKPKSDALCGVTAHYGEHDDA